MQSTDHRALAMGAGYEPPLLWLRHDRTPLKGVVRVMLNGTVLYHSLRTGAREASADTPLVMAPGCGRRLSKQEGTGRLIETIELRELPGFPGHTVSVQLLGAASSDTATGGAASTTDKVLGMRATALRTVEYSLTLDGEVVDADTASPDYLMKYSRYIARAGQWHQLCGTGQAHKLVSIKSTRKDASGTVQYSLDAGDTMLPADRTRWYRYSEFSQLYTDVCTCLRSSEWSKLPTLPPKTWSTGSASQNSRTVDLRRKALEDFIRAMMMSGRSCRNPYLLEFLGAFESDTWERYRAAGWPELCAPPESEPEQEALDLDALMGDIAGDLGEGDLHFAVTGKRTQSFSRSEAALATAETTEAEARVAAAAQAAAIVGTGASTSIIAEGVPPRGTAAASTTADAARARARSIGTRDEREARAAAARARGSVSTGACNGDASDISVSTPESDSDDDAL